MTFDRDKEISDNLPLVNYLIKKYWPVYDEDLYQIGCIGLIKAIDNYDHNKGYAKCTYYGKCILNEIYLYGRKMNSVKHGGNVKTISLNIHNNDYEREEYIDLIPSNINVEQEIINNENYIELYKVFDTLNKKEQLIIMYTFGLFNSDIKTQEEIAKLLNTTQSNVSRLIKKILKKMKGKMEYENNY